MPIRAGIVVKHCGIMLTAMFCVACGQSFAAPAEPTAYPHINLATSYRVDPAWPRHPENVQWGAMSGVAIDKAGRVWMLTRANPPVQVYDADGKFILSERTTRFGLAVRRP
jgi:peptidylamidoglycolate lyase